MPLPGLGTLGTVPGQPLLVSPSPSLLHNFQLTPPNEVFLSIMESQQHELSHSHVQTLMAPSLHGKGRLQRRGPFPH